MPFQSVLTIFIGGTQPPRKKLLTSNYWRFWNPSDFNRGCVRPSNNLWYLGSFLDFLNPFYIAHGCSFCFVTLFKLIKNLDLDNQSSFFLPDFLI